MRRTKDSKAAEQRDMQIQADGYTTIQFQHPKLRAAAKIDRGHYRMTPSEYRTHRLGRRSEDAITARFRHDERTRHPRRMVRR